MPIEETGNMIIMALSYVQKTGDKSMITTYVRSFPTFSHSYHLKADFDWYSRHYSNNGLDISLRTLLSLKTNCPQTISPVPWLTRRTWLLKEL